jgi:hypothetical protein
MNHQFHNNLGQVIYLIVAWWVLLGLVLDWMQL